MRFLVDVNASGSVARWLTEMGHDVAQVRNRDPRMSDSEVLAWAWKEERIIVTTDLDFEEMIWREGLQHRGGCVWKTFLGPSAKDSSRTCWRVSPPTWKQAPS